jgi:hypothetical protein
LQKRRVRFDGAAMRRQREESSRNTSRVLGGVRFVLRLDSSRIAGLRSRPAVEPLTDAFVTFVTFVVS